MTIEKRFYISASKNVKNMGSMIPPWVGNYNKNNWWSDGLTATDYFYSISGDSLYIQYGQNISLWATSKFFGQTVSIDNETVNDDGSINVEVTVTPNFFASRLTDFVATTGVRVKWTVKVNNNVVYTFDGLTNEEFTKGAVTAQRFKAKVMPQETFTGTALTLEVRYPNGEYKDSSITTGFSLFNPNLETFRPWAIRKSGTFKTLDKSSGFLNKRKGGAWQPIPKMMLNQQGAANKGTSRIRKSNIWVGQTKIGS